MKKLGVSSKSKVRQLVTIKGRRCAETKKVPNHRSRALTPGLCNSIAQTTWHHVATYYGNHAKTRCFVVANMASHPSPLLPAGLVLAVCTLHSQQLRKARVGSKRGRQRSGVQRTVDGTLSCTSRSSFALLYCHSDPGASQLRKTRGNAQELLALRRNILRAFWGRSRACPPGPPTRPRGL